MSRSRFTYQPQKKGSTLTNRRIATRRAAAVFAGVLTAAGLAVYGTAGSSAQTSAASHTPGKHYKITYVVPDETNAYDITQVCGTKIAAKQLGVSLNVVAPPPPGGVPQYATTLEAAISAHPNALIAQPPDDAKAFEVTLRRAAQSGMKVLFSDTAQDNRSYASGYVSSDNLGGGKLAADEMAKLTGGKGEVVALAPNTVLSLRNRLTGFTKELKKVAPKVKYLGAYYDPGYSDAKYVSIMVGLLSRYPDLTGIFANYDSPTTDVVTALREAGKLGKVHVVGFDPTPPVVADLRAGDIDAVVAQQPALENEMVVKQAVNVLNGGKPIAHTLVPTTLMTKQNVATTAPKDAYKSHC